MQNIILFNLVDSYKIIILMFVAVLLCSVLGLLSLTISILTNFEAQKLEQYECGFDPFDNAPEQPFNVHFYIIGVLFLIFDVEVSFLFPWIFGLNNINLFGIFTMIIFVILLVIGFYYEWKKGALKWSQS
jgi:NADH:ubiquinone oxidoreductase subunit 3 (subunit A)